jgi:hypothetical protein
VVRALVVLELAMASVVLVWVARELERALVSASTKKKTHTHTHTHTHKCESFSLQQQTNETNRGRRLKRRCGSRWTIVGRYDTNVAAARVGACETAALSAAPATRGALIGARHAIAVCWARLTRLRRRRSIHIYISKIIVLLYDLL